MYRHTISPHDARTILFTAFLAVGGFRQVILVGSGRPIHRVACKAAKAIGVRILSLEEGYIRPGYVTVEPDGNNADSPLAGRLPPEDFVEDRKAQEQAVDYDSFRIMAFYAAVYYLVRALFSTRSEEHTSELQSLMRISYAVFCLKKKKT